MAKPTPLLTSNAFQGDKNHQGHIHFSNYNNNIHPNPLRAHSQSTKNKHDRPKNITTIPIRLVVGGGGGGPTQKHVPTSAVTHGSEVRKLGVVLTTSSPRPSPRLASSRPKKGHPPLTRLYSSHHPQRRIVSTPPSTPRVVHFKTTPPCEDPPPYEQIFNVTHDEATEPVECPSVLASGSPRKEKKRSLRSRLLRHITGKKAAEHAAHRMTRVTSSSLKRKDSSSSISVGSGIVKKVADDQVQIVDTSSPTQPVLNEQTITLHSHNTNQFPNLDHRNGFLNVSDVSNPIQVQHSSNQVIVLNTVPEEETCESTLASTVNTSLPSSIHVSTSIHSMPSSSSSAFSDPLCTSQSSQSFMHHSSVFIHSHPSTQSSSSSSESENLPFQKTSQPTHQKSEEVYNKVPQTRTFDRSFSHETSEVNSDKLFSRVNHNSTSNRKMRDRTQSAYVAKSADTRKTKSNDSKTEEIPTVQVEEDLQTKTFTINLKPGMYKLNLNFANKKKEAQPQSINITIPSNETKSNPPSHGIGKPPPVPESLYYENSRVSLPQRFAHMLKSNSGSARTSSSKTQPKVTIVQQNPGSRGQTTVTVVSPSDNRQQVIQPVSSSRGQKKGASCPLRSAKKERYRWAPFSCIHISSSGLEETVSETSGCDSLQGYEGVEHLKRQSDCKKIVKYSTPINDHDSSCEFCRNEQMLAKKINSRNGIEYNYHQEKDISCGDISKTCVISSNQIVSNHNSSYLVNSHYNDKSYNQSSVLYPNLEKKWLESEVFLKKVVDEYFMDPITSSEDSDDCDTTPQYDSGSDLSLLSDDSNIRDDEVSMIDAQVFFQKSEESCIKTLEKCDAATSSMDNSFDDSFYCDNDETMSSLFSDDSLGYDGDVEEGDVFKYMEKLRKKYLIDTSTDLLNTLEPIKKNDLSNEARDNSACDVGNDLNELGNDLRIHAARPPIPVPCESTEAVKLARERAIGTELGKESKSVEREGRRVVSHLAIDTSSGGSDDFFTGGCVAISNSATSLIRHQCHVECCSVGGACITSRVNTNNSTQILPCSNESNINIGIKKVKPLKLRKFVDTVALSNSSSLNSFVTESSDSLCSICRKQTNVKISNDCYSDSNTAIDELDVQSTSSNENPISCSALNKGLVFERSDLSCTQPKFDLQAALKSLRELEQTNDVTSLTSLSDSVFDHNDALSCDTLSSDDMADIDLAGYRSQSFYNSNIIKLKDTICETNSMSNRLIASDNMDTYVNDVRPPKARQRRSPKQKNVGIDDRYESFEFKGSEPDVKMPSNNITNRAFSSQIRNQGLVRLSGSSTDDDRNQDIVSVKPGRKRFAKAFQRAVIQVPVSAAKEITPTVKSEFVIDPSFQKSNLVTLNQPCVPTCISEYKIGTTPSLPVKVGHSVTAKSPNFDNSSSDTDSKKAKKSKKSNTRKYFSGILDAIGNAAPIFRSSLVSNSSCDDRDIISDSTTTPTRVNKFDDSYPIKHFAQCSPVASNCSSTASRDIQTSRQEIVDVNNCTADGVKSSPILAGSHENNCTASPIHNHWRTAYLGHVGCDSPLANSEQEEFDDSDIISNVHWRGKKNFNSKSDDEICNNSGEQMYENVVFHKNLKKVSNLDDSSCVSDNISDSDTGNSINITTTATVTLECPTLNKHYSDISQSSSIITKISDDRIEQPRASNSRKYDTCTVSASFSLADLHYEDWSSAVGDHEDTRQESDTESSFDRKSTSSESLHSEASSFYYTAGANTIYEAVKSVRKSFADEYAYSENSEAASTFDSSDEITYNTSQYEKSFACTDDGFTEALNIGGSSSPTNSTGSDLIEQLNELQEKYFGAHNNSTEHFSSSKCRSSSSSDVNENNFVSGFNPLPEGLVRAVPCVVHSDSDSRSNEFHQRSRPNSRKKRSIGSDRRSSENEFHKKSENTNLNKSKVNPRSEPQEFKITKPRSRIYANLNCNDSEDEVDKRVSGIWTTGTGGDADEESCADNSDSADYSSKLYHLPQKTKCLDNLEGKFSLDIENESNLRSNSSNHRNTLESDGRSNLRFSSGRKNNSKFSKLDENNGLLNENYDSFLGSYENVSNFNECTRTTNSDVEEIPEFNYADVSTLPEFDICDENLLNVSNDEKVLHETSFHEVDSDQSLNYDVNDSYDSIILEDISKAITEEPQQDLLSVPEENDNFTHSYQDSFIGDPNNKNSSLLDDVITCLGGKWHVSAPSSYPSSPAHKSEDTTPPVRRNSSRSSRIGKPPVSPGTRPKESFQSRSSNVSRAQSRRRSRSASAGAKLRGASSSRAVERPASMVGLPRPSSLADIVPEDVVLLKQRQPPYSSSQESLHSLSLMPNNLDDLAPRPQW